MSALEEALDFQLVAAGLGGFEREYHFHMEGRRNPHRFDFAYPQYKLAVEVQGGTWKPGMGHSSGSGIAHGYEKINAAQIAGWVVLQVTSDMVKDGRALSVIELAVKHSREGAI